MKLPEDQYGNLDTGAIEHLLSVSEFLGLLFILGRTQKTLWTVGPPSGMSDIRSLQKMRDWGLVTLKSAPTPEHPMGISRSLTISGEILAATYANEVQRLAQLAAPSSPSPSAD